MMFSGVTGDQGVAFHKDSVFINFLASWLGLTSLGDNRSLVEIVLLVLILCHLSCT